MGERGLRPAVTERIGSGTEGMLHTPHIEVVTAYSESQAGLLSPEAALRWSTLLLLMGVVREPGSETFDAKVDTPLLPTGLIEPKAMSTSAERRHNREFHKQRDPFIELMNGLVAEWVRQMRDRLPKPNTWSDVQRMQFGTEQRVKTHSERRREQTTSSWRDDLSLALWAVGDWWRTRHERSGGRGLVGGAVELVREAVHGWRELPFGEKMKSVMMGLPVVVPIGQVGHVSHMTVPMESRVAVTAPALGEVGVDKHMARVMDTFRQYGRAGVTRGTSRSELDRMRELTGVQGRTRMELADGYVQQLEDSGLGLGRFEKVLIGDLMKQGVVPVFEGKGMKLVDAKTGKVLMKLKIADEGTDSDAVMEQTGGPGDCINDSNGLVSCILYPNGDLSIQVNGTANEVINLNDLCNKLLPSDPVACFDYLRLFADDPTGLDVKRLEIAGVESENGIPKRIPITSPQSEVGQKTRDWIHFYPALRAVIVGWDLQNGLVVTEVPNQGQSAEQVIQTITSTPLVSEIQSGEGKGQAGEAQQRSGSGNLEGIGLGLLCWLGIAAFGYIGYQILKWASPDVGSK